MPDELRKPKLTPEQQDYVRQCLACGYGYQMTADSLNDVHGVRISKQTVQWYAEHDAERITAMRDALAKDLSGIPFADKRTRVKALSDMATRMQKSKRDRDLRATLDQIAKEVDGIKVTSDLSIIFTGEDQLED
jgi:hypothetical protein